MSKIIIHTCDIIKPIRNNYCTISSLVVTIEQIDIMFISFS